MPDFLLVGSTKYLTVISGRRRNARNLDYGLTRGGIKHFSNF